MINVHIILMLFHFFLIVSKAQRIQFRLLTECISSPECAKLCFCVNNAECYTLLPANDLMPTGKTYNFMDFSVIRIRKCCEDQIVKWSHSWLYRLQGHLCS